MIKYSVVIVDDHTLLSQAIAAMVNTFSKFKVLYTCKNGKELIDKFSSSPKFIPDVVLMDINMPIMNGIETTEWITKKHQDVNVMALSVEDEEESEGKRVISNNGDSIQDIESSNDGSKVDMHAVLLDNESVHTIGFEDAEGNDIRNSDPNINVSKMYNKNLTTLIKKQGRQPKKQNGYRFQEEIKKLMYGYSDDLNPSDETSELMEQYIIEYLSNICNLVLRRSHRGGHNCM